MSFSRRIGKWNSEAERRMRLVFRRASKRVADEANVTQAKGGRLPLDTGFLRASQTGALNQMPSGPGKPKKKKYREGTYVGGSPTVAIGTWRPGDVLYIGWTAVYARYMEYRFGFMKGATQNWNKYVQEELRKTK